MAYDFTGFNRAADLTIEWLKREFSGIRTGRAAPAILDNVSVSAYGSKVPINQVATISVEGPKSLRIIPWDKNVSKDIDSAIRESNLGVSVSIDDQGLRVSFPELTSERRTMLTKLAKEKYEESRITLRGERERVLADIDKKEKAGEMSEDDKFRHRAELQKKVDETNNTLEALFEKKEKEILD
jgi:ribosome recycling factor